MLVAQISDFHVVAPGRLAYGRVDTGAMLARAVSTLNTLAPQPDLVIGSGDLVQGGAPEEYAAVRALLAPLQAPFLPVAGNHDDRRALVEAFRDLDLAWGPAGFVQYAHETPRLRVIALDTVTAGSDDASFCRVRAGWLARTLAASPKPALIALHHPPFRTGVPWMDPTTLEWTQELRRAITPYSRRVVGFVCGHIHRSIQTRAFGKPASACPSTAHQVALGLADETPRLSLEAPGFQLHRIEGRELVTYTASLERFGDAFAPSTEPAEASGHG